MVFNAQQIIVVVVLETGILSNVFLSSLIHPIRFNKNQFKDNFYDFYFTNILKYVMYSTLLYSFDVFKKLNKIKHLWKKMTNIKILKIYM